jgi:hypothetical protein
MAKPINQVELPEELKFTKENGWTLVKHDENTKAYFFRKDDVKIAYWHGKRTVAITSNGEQRYFRKLAADEVETVFKKPLWIYDYGYTERTTENRNWLRWGKNDPDFSNYKN